MEAVTPVASPVVQPTAPVEESGSPFLGLALTFSVAFATTLLWQMTIGKNRKTVGVNVKSSSPKTDSVNKNDISNGSVSNVSGSKKNQQKPTQQNQVKQVDGVKVVGQVSKNDAQKNEKNRIRKQGILKRINELNLRISTLGRSYDQHRLRVQLSNELALLNAQARLI